MMVKVHTGFPKDDLGLFPSTNHASPDLSTAPVPGHPLPSSHLRKHRCVWSSGRRSHRGPAQRSNTSGFRCRTHGSATDVKMASSD